MASLTGKGKGQSRVSKEARGKRLRQLRELTSSISGKPLTRAAIERRYGLSANTLRNWEEAYRKGLTETGARRVLDIYQRECIHCSMNWLLKGEGTPPKRQLSEPAQAPFSSVQTDPLKTIDDECEYFKSLHLEAAIFEVKDDAMMPVYQVGDRVGGVRHYAQDFKELLDIDCIIEMKTHKTWFRRLQRSTVPNQYNLYALNPSTKVERPTLYSVEVLTVAPVVRHWRGKKWFR